MGFLPPVAAGRRRARAYNPNATAADPTIVTRPTRGHWHIALVAATIRASVTRYSSSGDVTRPSLPRDDPASLNLDRAKRAAVDFQHLAD
jgi:hypothetical protein